MNIQEREQFLEKYKEKLQLAEEEHSEEAAELEVIVKAIIKTIPEKVTNHICPYCGRMIQIKKNFCSNCGQATR